MYKCEHTGKMIGPNVPENKIVVERRKKIYEKVIKRGPREHRGKIELVEGWEIIKEIRVGPEAYEQLTGRKPAGQKHPTKLDIVPQEQFKKPRRRKGKRRKPQQEDTNRKKPVVQVVNPIKVVKE